MLCRVLHVNRSTYYNFINKKPSKREIENQRLRKLLLEIYMKFMLFLESLKQKQKTF